MGDSLSPRLRKMTGSMQQMHRQMMGAAERPGMRGVQQDTTGRGMRGQGRMARHHQQMHAGADYEWHQQMMVMHRQMAQMHDGQQPRMASQHRRMMRWHGQIYESAPEEALTSSPSSSTEDVVASGGEAIYQGQCAACHGIDGQGMAGTFPPLDGTAWLTGDADRLVRLLLHGLQGPVDVGGTRYNGVMPAFGSRLDDDEIAAVLTYIRTSWGNQASAVTAEAVQGVRAEYSGRTGPWSASELK
jgi:mono/diheme cytochrome c family protein